MADDEHESLRRVHGYIATVSTVGQPRCDSLVGSLSFCEMAHETRRPNITNSDHPPNDVPRHRWRQFVDDCRRFLSASENWVECVQRLDWDAALTPDALFQPRQSDARDLMVKPGQPCGAVGSLSFREMAHETRRSNITNSCDIPSRDGAFRKRAPSPDRPRCPRGTPS